jgi:hypothetical protein
VREALIVLAAASCFDRSNSTPAQPIPCDEPRTCSARLTLVGGTTATPVVAGPFALDTHGVAVCLHLDATALHRAHFAAATRYENGTTSPLATTLQDSTFHAIRDGSDMTVGDSAPRTSTNLEWGPPAGAATDVILWVRTKAGTVTSEIDVWLFDPLE